MFQKGNWVSISYGEYAGRYGRVTVVHRDGRCGVLPYDEKNEPGQVQDLYADGLTLIPAYQVEPEELKELVQAKKLYSQIAEKIFPAFNLCASQPYPLASEDIMEALLRINREKDCLARFKEWFWLIQNVFYEDLKIADRYREEVFSDAPEEETELFSTVYGLTEKLYWKLEERFVSREDTEKYIVKFDLEPGWNEAALHSTALEEAAYRAVCEDIISRVRTFAYNRERPREEWVYSPSQKRHFINLYEEGSDELLHASREVKTLYKRFTADLFQLGDVQAMKLLAWGYFEGGSVYRQSFRQAEKYLDVLFRKTGDPYAACALGHISYYGLAGKKEPDYEKAFRYFSYGALSGLDEAVYMSAEMLIYGKGTIRNIDMGLNLIVDGYRETMFQFSSGEYENRFADYAFRMGNVCRENMILGMGIRDAFKFYLEADYAIRRRLETGGLYGDTETAERISTALKEVREQLLPDPDISVLKADFPIYISHMFEDRYPIRIAILKERDGYYLKMSRFRLIPGDEPKILVTLPELSYVDLVSELKFRLEDVGVIRHPEKGSTFLADGFAKNEMTGALEFYYGGELAAAIEAKWYVIDIAKEKILQKMNQHIKGE